MFRVFLGLALVMASEEVRVKREEKRWLFSKSIICDGVFVGADLVSASYCEIGHFALTDAGRTQFVPMVALVANVL